MSTQSNLRRPFLAFLTVAVATAAGACEDDGGPNPGTLRFGQLGTVEIRLEAPPPLGVGTLTQILRWGSTGEWSLQEAISYRGLQGDGTFTRNTSDLGPSASAYASFITQINEVTGLELFIDSLPQQPDPPDPTCGPTRTRLIFSIFDEARLENRRWVACVDGSLGTVSPMGAGPYTASSRLAVATQLARDGSVGKSFVSKYAGSVPFGTLDRGDNTPGPQRTPTALTDSASWAEFWDSHAPGRPLPSVDFAEEMVVVGIVGVRREAGDSVEVRRILPVDQGTLLEVYERVPGDFCSPAARSHVPFHVVVAPRTPEPLRFADIRVERVPCGG